MTITSPVVGPGVSNSTRNSYDAVFLFADINPNCPGVADITQLTARFRSITERILFYAVRCTIANGGNCSKMKRLETALRMHQPGYEDKYPSLLAAQREQADQHMRMCANQTYAQLVMRRALIVAFSVFGDEPGVVQRPQYTYHPYAERLSIAKHVRPVRRSLRKRRGKRALADHMSEDVQCSDSRPVSIPTKRRKLE